MDSWGLEPETQLLAVFVYVVNCLSVVLRVCLLFCDTSLLCSSISAGS